MPDAIVFPAKTRRMPLPPLVQRSPLCPICEDAVWWDDIGWRCNTCSGFWDSDAYDAEGKADEEVEQCPAEVQPYINHGERFKHIATYRYRCVRDDGHPLSLGDRHIGREVDDRDNTGDPFEWDEDQYPRVDAAARQEAADA